MKENGIFTIVFPDEEEYKRNAITQSHEYDQKGICCSQKTYRPTEGV